MYRKTLVILSATILLLFAARAVQAGGWATVTLDEVPLVLHAGEPVVLGFTVLQHGVHPLTLEQVPGFIIQNSNDGEEISFEARGDGDAGHYVVDVTFPRAGEWTWRTDIRPFPSVELGSVVVEPNGATTAGVPRDDLLPSLAIVTMGLVLAFWRGSMHRWQGIAIGAVTAAALAVVWLQMPLSFAANSAPEAADATYGRTLFAAKGCTGCHLHAAVPTSFSTEMGPDLTQYSRDDEFLRAWLRDPQAVRANTTMPDLQLNDREIDALITFLNEKS